MDLILGLLFLAVIDLFTPASSACVGYLVTTGKPYRHSITFIAANYVTWMVLGLLFFLLFGVLWWGTVIAWYVRDYIELIIGVCLVGVGAFSHTSQFSFSRFEKHLSFWKLSIAGGIASIMQLPASLTFVAAVALMHQHGVQIYHAIPLMLIYCVSFVLFPIIIVLTRSLSGENYHHAVHLVFIYVIAPFKHIFRLIVAIIGVAFILHWCILHLVFGLHARPDWNIPERPHKRGQEIQTTKQALPRGTTDIIAQ